MKVDDNIKELTSSIATTIVNHKIIDGKEDIFSLFNSNCGICENDMVHFCEGFFIAGLEMNVKPQLLTQSEGTTAACNHSVCSLLPALSPNIIFRIPQKDTPQLEINELVNSSKLKT